MASQKLTRWNREQIVRGLLKHGHQTKVEELINEQAVFACMLYDLFFEEHQKKIKNTPKGWLPLKNDIAVVFDSGNKYERLFFNGTSSICGELSVVLGKFPEEVTRVFPESLRKTYLCDSKKLIQEQLALVEKRENLKEDIKRAKRDTWAVLNSVTTTNKLIEVWPEIEPFVSTGSSPKQEVVKIDQIISLNHIFALPVVSE